MTIDYEAWEDYIGYWDEVSWVEADELAKAEAEAEYEASEKAREEAEENFVLESADYIEYSLMGYKFVA